MKLDEQNLKTTKTSLKIIKLCFRSRKFEYLQQQKPKILENLRKKLKLAKNLDKTLKTLGQK